MTSHPPSRNTTFYKAAWTLVYAGSVLALFLIVHLTASRISWLLRRWTRESILPTITANTDIIRAYAPALKSIIFLMALIVLCVPIALDLYREFKASKIANILQVGLSAVLISLLLYILIFRPQTDSMGTNYAIIAQNPFLQESGAHNTRLLMPVLAYFLFLRDFQPYYIYSAVLTTSFIALLIRWTSHHAPLRLWQIFSLCTCSFVLFQYEYGGYPDILVFIFYILVMQDFTRPSSKLSLLILALLAHEASVFVGVVLAWRYLDRKGLLLYILAVVAYLLIWYGISGQNVDVMLKGHRVNGLSGAVWLAHAPLKELAGVLVSYKAVWILFFVSLWIAYKKRLFSDMVFILACVGAGIFMTTLGVDTSRLMGFAFPGFLIALAIVSMHYEQVQRGRILSFVFLLNLILPAFNIGLNTGLEYFPGLYKIAYGWMSALLP